MKNLGHVRVPPTHPEKLKIAKTGCSDALTPTSGPKGSYRYVPDKGPESWDRTTK